MILQGNSTTRLCWTRIKRKRW